MAAPKNILVVEDNKHLLNAYSRILKKEGYNVFSAETAKEGMKIITNETIALVLLDIVLPDTNGIDLLKIIKADPETADIFVVLMSSVHKTTDDKSEGLDKGADGFLTKPIHNKELVARINSFMRLKRTIDDLIESEARFRKITETVYDGILIIDKKGVIRFSNPAADRMFNQAESTLLNMEFGYPVIGRDSAEIQTFGGKEDSRTGELRMVNIGWENEEMTLVSVRDITERMNYESKLHKAMLKAEESDRLKSAFLSNMSHEIRTPMNAIMGFSDLLVDPDINEEDKSSYIDIIQNSGAQLMRIIDDILDIARLDANQLHIEKEWFELNGMLQEIIRKHEESKLKKQKPGVELRLKSSIPSGDVKLFTDKKRLSQVIDNLISNALKFTDKGSIEVSYSQFYNDEGNFIQFSIRDTGVGMSEKEQKIIFDRFRQIDNEMKSDGTGLGLSITKGILKILGGEIWVLSREGKGTTFRFIIPYETPKSKTLYINTRNEIADTPNFEDKTVYIAEDDIYSYMLLEELLKSTKVKILHAENGVKLVEMVKKKIPDLILLDIRMPIMDGHEALQRIRQISGEVPVISQTAYALREEEAKILESGANAYIKKPIVQNELLSLMNNFLS